MLDAAEAILEVLGPHWEYLYNTPGLWRVDCKCCGDRHFTVFNYDKDCFASYYSLDEDYEKKFVDLERLNLSHPGFFDQLRKAVEHPHD